MIISDLQIPFETKHALAFCKQVKKDYKVPDDGVICVGDETDNYFGGLYKKDPNAYHTPTSEAEETREKLKEWYAAFPRVDLVESNHGSRWLRKATDAEIPAFMIKEYKEIIKAPPGWRWQKKLLVKEKFPFIVEHGDEFGGEFPHRAAALYNGVSTAIGHHHCVSGVEYMNTEFARRWAMAVGCLIDFEKYAFKYGHKSKRRPVLSIGVVVDNGARAYVETLLT